jgi:hypothetical protein
VIPLLAKNVMDTPEVKMDYLVMTLLAFAFILKVLSLILLPVSIIWFIAKGPTKGAKIATFLLVICTALSVTLETQSLEGIFLLMFVLVTATIGGIIGLVGWRGAYPLRLRDMEGADWPGYAKSKIHTWTERLQELGYSMESDKTGDWKAFGTRRKSFRRFFRHPQDNIWFEVGALTAPKSVSKRAVTKLKDERCLITSDGLSNEEFLPDSVVIIQRVQRDIDCGELLRRHKELMAKHNGDTERPVDLSKAAEDINNNWIRRLIESNRLRLKDGWVKVASAQLPILQLKVLGAWSH